MFFIHRCIMDMTKYKFLQQGVAMPAMNNILSKWVPVSERSRSLALVYSGMYLGSVTGLAFSPFLIYKFGWPSVFYSFGSLGTVWFVTWAAKVLRCCELLCNFSDFVFIMSEFVVCYLERLIVLRLRIRGLVLKKRSLSLVKSHQESLLQQFHGE